MAKVPAAIMRLHLQELASLLASDMTDKQIMTQLGLKRRTYFYRKSCVHKIWGNIAAKKTKAVLEFEADVLKDRFLRLYRQLEENIAKSTFKLEIEGSRYRQVRRELKQAEGLQA